MRIDNIDRINELTESTCSIISKDNKTINVQGTFDDLSKLVTD